MSNFTDWCWSAQAAKLETISQLLEFSKTNKDTWSKTSNDKGEYEEYIRKLLPDDPDRAKVLISELQLAWNEWEKSSVPVAGPGMNPIGKLAKFGAMLFTNAAAIIAIIVVLAFLFVVLDAFLSDTGVLTKVSDIATARGAITFLFAFGTIILALMLVGSALFGAAQNEAEFKQRKDRFNQGKEILAILIGILGTIVGFYFGTPTSSEDSDSLALSDPIILNTTPAPGEKFSLVAQVIGGTPPYNYTIIFDKDFNIDNLEKQASGTGLIVQEFTVPDASESGVEQAFTISVADSASKTAEKELKITVK